MKILEKFPMKSFASIVGRSEGWDETLDEWLLGNSHLLQVLLKISFAAFFIQYLKPFGFTFRIHPLSLHRL